jgi:hypothetical protein
MAMKNYRVKIVRGDLQIEAEGDKNFVIQMLAKYDGGAAGSVSLPPSLPAKQPGRKGRNVAVGQLASARSVSAGEFIRQFHFKKHTDFVLAFGYYLEQHSGLHEFTAADINNCYYEAKLESSNTSQMIIQDIKRGYIMEAKSSGKGKKRGKLFTLTQSGEEYLQSALAAGGDS